jgi:hypothetical protein
VVTKGVIIKGVYYMYFEHVFVLWGFQVWTGVGLVSDFEDIREFFVLGLFFILPQVGVSIY